MSLESLYPDHVRELRQRMDNAFSEVEFDALVIHSGTPLEYFADDHEVPFHATPHFAHWTPQPGPGHLLVLRPGEKPLLIAHCPDDFWSEPIRVGEAFWTSEFEIRQVGSPDEALKEIPFSVTEKIAFHGDCVTWAMSHGFSDSSINPSSLIQRMDWSRSYKTDYEIACIEKAAEIAARGFKAAKAAFEENGSELNIHHAFVQAAECTDDALAFPSIVALDEKAAILHYPIKRKEGQGRVCLVDAGARHLGYASDITRTFVREGCHPVFKSLLEGMNRGQMRLCDETRTGVAFGDLHQKTHLLVGDLLCEAGVLDVRDGEGAFEMGLTHPFFPHGLGHFLGIQVHDVAGRQKGPEGGTRPPPEGHPFLRTTRTLEDRQVLTIEPGLYFIDLLLKPHRDGEHRARFNWTLIDELLPFGGIRIEDDVVVNGASPKNLTRKYLP